jgi:hypothetical protein
MKARTERKIIRWIHIICSIPIIGFIYGPVAENPNAVFSIRWVIFPVVILSGFWMWLGPRLKRRFKQRHLGQRA